MGGVTTSYQPISQALLADQNDHGVLQAMYEHVQASLGEKWTDFSAVENLDGVPIPAKVAWYVWWFVAEAGGSGIPGYLANHANSTAEVVNFHRSLGAIGALEAVELLEAAIALETLEDSLPEDLQSSWFSQFPKNPHWADWDSIESRSFELLSGPVSSLAAAYLRAHSDEL